jgi:hypothetical protein
MRKFATLLILICLAASPLLASGKSHKSRKPDHRPNHESKNKMVGGQGSSHKGGHFKPGAHKSPSK